MIVMQHVNMVYPNSVGALNDINFSVERGEFVFIVGTSGAGKSTLIRLIGREFLPTSGSIRVFSKEITRLRRREVSMFRRSIGVVFQDFRLLDKRTIYDNVAFAMQVVGATPREVRRRVPEALEMVGLTGKAKRKPHELSGGEQQRVCLARAIINQPSLVVADEPTGNLDPDITNDIMLLFRTINMSGTTVVIATHSRELLENTEQRIIILKGGKIIKEIS